MQVLSVFYKWLNGHCLLVWMLLCAGVFLLMMLGKKEHRHDRPIARGQVSFGLRECIWLEVTLILVMFGVHAMLGTLIHVPIRQSLLLFLIGDYYTMLMLTLVLGLIGYVVRKRYLRPLISRVVKTLRVKQKTGHRRCCRLR